MISVKDVPYLFDYDGTPIRALSRFFDIEVDHELDANSVMTIDLRMLENVKAEQQIIYRGARYIVNEVITKRNDQTRTVIAEIAYVQLGERTKSINRPDSTLQGAAEWLLAGTGWTIGVIDATSELNDIITDKGSVLGLLRQLATLYDRDLRFDTMNRRVSFRTNGFGAVNFNFAYRKNLEGVERREVAPTATVIFPYGNDGLTIKDVNGGLEYLEDFSWYTAKGFTLAQAREQFTKVEEFTDDRYGKPASLKKEAQKRLAKSSRARYSYAATVGSLDRKVRVGDYGYVVDEELGIKVNLSIVRLVERNNPADSEVELDTPRPGIVDMMKKGWVGSGKSGGGKGWSGQQSGGATPPRTLPKTAYGSNSAGMSVGAVYQKVLELTINNDIAANLIGSLNLAGQASAPGLLELEVKMDDVLVSSHKRTVSSAGWVDFSRQISLTQVQPGSHRITAHVRISAGTLTIERNAAELIFQSDAITNDIGAARPDINVVENVTLSSNISVVESCIIDIVTP